MDPAELADRYFTHVYDRTCDMHRATFVSFVVGRPYLAAYLWRLDSPQAPEVPERAVTAAHRDLAWFQREMNAAIADADSTSWRARCRTL